MSDTRVSHFRAQHAKVDTACNVASYNAKSIVAFIALLVTNMAAEVAATGQPWPTNLSGWITLVATTIGGTWLVWSRANGPKPTMARHRSDDKPPPHSSDDKPPPHPPLPAEG